MDPPPNHNTLEVCNRITVLIFVCINSRLITLLKVTDAPILVCDILVVLLVSNSSISAFRYSFYLFLKCLLASRLPVFRLSTLLWFGPWTHCILACCLWYKYRKHSSLNRGLCCFNSYRPKLSFAEVLIFSVVSSLALFKSSQLCEFSNAAKLFEISVWYCFLTSMSFIFLRFSLSTSNFCVNCLLIASLSPTFANTR